jgi:hypothetical protein
MLDGSVNYFQGAEAILALREEQGIYANDPDFVVFAGVLNEVEYLRNDSGSFNWVLLTDPALQKQIAGSLAWAKEISLENCESLVRRFSGLD